jgi:hypothetical protein
MSSRSFSLVFVLILLPALVACSGEKEYRPGELEFNKSVEAAEYILEKEDAVEYCGSLRQHYDQGVAAFKRLLPSLKGMQIRTRDARLGEIRDFVEKNC